MAVRSSGVFSAKDDVVIRILFISTSVVYNLSAYLCQTVDTGVHQHGDVQAVGNETVTFPVSAHRIRNIRLNNMDAGSNAVPPAGVAYGIDGFDHFGVIE